MGILDCSSKMSFEDFKFFSFRAEGTRFMEAFNYPFANVLNMGFLANTLFYTMLGAFALVFFFLFAIGLSPTTLNSGVYLCFRLFLFAQLTLLVGWVRERHAVFVRCPVCLWFAKPDEADPVAGNFHSPFLPYSSTYNVVLLMAFGVSYLLSGKIPVSEVLFRYCLWGQALLFYLRYLNLLK